MSRTSFLAKSVMLALAVVLVAGATSFAQNQQRQRQRGGFGFGGRGGGLSKSVLLRAEQVRKELKISEDQQAKITALNESSRTNIRELFSGLRDLSEEERRAKIQKLREKMQKAAEETNKKLGEILTADQSKRLDEILLQQRGIAALTDQKIAAALKINKEQQQQIKDLVDARRRMEGELYSGLRDLSREERRKKFEELRGKRDEIRTETDKAVLEILTATQRSQLEQMNGKKFELDRGALFRGFGGNRSRRPGGGNNNNNNNRNRRPDA